MRDENDLVRWALIVLGILAAMWAFWRVWTYEKETSVYPYNNPSAKTTIHTSRDKQKQAQTPSLEELKRQEILDTIEPQGYETHLPISVSQKNISSAPVTKQQYSSVSANLPHQFHSRNAGTVSQNRTVPTSATVGTGSRPNYTSKAGVYTPTVQEAMEQERARTLAPYLIPNKKAQQNLDHQLADLSSSITRSLNRILTPKSKKDANIEKYLNRDSAPAADPFTEVINQVKAQKTGIVQQTQSAFGRAAGQRAGALMDAFQQDVSQAASNPAQTEQQKAQAVQEIAKKYQKELDKMNQENQFNKFAEERLNSDNEKLAALQNAYADQDALKEQFAQIIAQSREADLQLAQRTDLTADEYAKTFYANQYKMQEDLKQAVQKAGASSLPLNKVLTQLADADVADKLKQEEEGAIASFPRKMAEQDLGGLLKQIDDERTKMLSNIEAQYGKETAARFEPVLKEYRQKNLELGMTELSDAQRRQEQLKTVKEFNQKILRVQLELVQESNAPQEEKEAQIRQLQQAIDDLN